MLRISAGFDGRAAGRGSGAGGRTLTGGFCTRRSLECGFGAMMTVHCFFETELEGDGVGLTWKRLPRFDSGGIKTRRLRQKLAPEA